MNSGTSMETEFALLVESLKTPLPTRPEMVDTVRELVATCEAYGVVVSQYVRLLSQKVDQDTDRVMKDLRNGVTLNDDGEFIADEDIGKAYQKLVADEKKAAVAGLMAETNAKLEYVKNLDSLIKRRVSVGQSFIKSIAEEKR